MLPGEVYAAVFDRLIGMLADAYNVLPLDEALERRRLGELPPRAVVVTFDDGYEDNFSVALPILKKHGVAASFFVSTGFLSGGVMFNDRVREAIRLTRHEELNLDWLDLGVCRPGPLAVRERLVGGILRRIKYMPLDVREAALARLEAEAEVSPASGIMMSAAQVKGLEDAGMIVGGHTVNHPILAVLDERGARDEIETNRAELGSILGHAPRFFAYPNGKPGEDYSARDVELVRRAGYEAALSTSVGSVGPESDVFQLPRFTPWDRTAGRFALRLAHNFLRVGAPQLAG